jgi:hypothetical protein
LLSRFSAVALLSRFSAAQVMDVGNFLAAQAASGGSTPTGAKTIVSKFSAEIEVLHPAKQSLACRGCTR